MTKFNKISTFILVLLYPGFSKAQGMEGLTGLVATMGEIVEMLIPLIIGFILIAFLWGVLKFVFNAGDEEERAKGKQFMVWGIIGLFIAVSVWGIVRFLQESVGMTDPTPPPPPPQTPS